jgi:hypothetical protein
MLLINLLGVLHVLAARSKGSPDTPRLGRAVHEVVTAVLLPVTAIVMLLPFRSCGFVAQRLSGWYSEHHLGFA